MRWKKGKNEGKNSIWYNQSDKMIFHKMKQKSAHFKSWAKRKSAIFSIKKIFYSRLCANNFFFFCTDFRSIYSIIRSFTSVSSSHFYNAMHQTKENLGWKICCYLNTFQLRCQSVTLVISTDWLWIIFCSYFRSTKTRFNVYRVF